MGDSTTGTALIRSPVDFVSLTGSVSTGVKIAREAAMAVGETSGQAGEPRRVVSSQARRQEHPEPGTQPLLKEADPELEKLLDEEGIFAGVSSGAIARIAVRIGEELEGGNVVFLIPDDGWKYLSSGVYTKPIDEIENLDSTVWW